MCRKMPFLPALLLASLAAAQVPTKPAVGLSTTTPAVVFPSSGTMWQTPQKVKGTGEQKPRAGGGGGDCQSDAERLCPPEENQQGKRAQCLRRHYADLSRGCADSHPDWRPTHEAAQIMALPWKDLAADWRAECPGAAQGACREAQGSEAAWWRCLDARWKDQPMSCKTFARTHSAWQRRCPGELGEYCNGVEAERQTECMAARRHDLGKECRAFADQVRPAKAPAKKNPAKPAKPASPKRAAPRP